MWGSELGMQQGGHREPVPRAHSFEGLGGPQEARVQALSDQSGYWVQKRLGDGRKEENQGNSVSRRQLQNLY